MSNEVKEAKTFEDMTKEELISSCKLLVNQREMAIRANEELKQQFRNEMFNLDVIFRIIHERDAFPAEFVQSLVETVMNSFVKEEGQEETNE